MFHTFGVLGLACHNTQRIEVLCISFVVQSNHIRLLHIRIDAIQNNHSLIVLHIITGLNGISAYLAGAERGVSL